MPKLYPPLKKVTHAGVAGSSTEAGIRAVILTNVLAIICAGLASFYLAFRIMMGWYGGWLTISLAILSMIAVPYMNHLGMRRAGKVVLSLAIPAAAIIAAFRPRMPTPEEYSPDLSPGIYCVVLTTAAIPILVFLMTERRLMFFCLTINFIAYASIGILFYYFSELRAWPTPEQYFGKNLAPLSAYFLLMGSMLSLRTITDRYEQRNRQLIDTLHRTNDELKEANFSLHEANMNVEAQNEEIQAQSEELTVSQESLQLANAEIERQNQALARQNELLAEKLDEKTRDLLLTNQHLIEQNNELQQFSYTVSHNLRGPVASMLGLLNIHRYSQDSDERQRILTLLENSAKSLETVIADLNKIIDIRRDKYAVFEKVYMDRELDLIRQTLNSFIKKTGATIEADFQVNEITTVKAYLNSILYNLISNAIQYRSFNRTPVVSISTARSDGFVEIRVSDNGLGIDLDKHQEEMFKIYKRFHLHTEGKGLGLYLVKQKVEKLNGRIEVASVPDTGTTFNVFLPARSAQDTSPATGTTGIPG